MTGEKGSEFKEEVPKWMSVEVSGGEIGFQKNKKGKSTESVRRQDSNWTAKFYPERS